ncbi:MULTISPECIES: hypothetical protein [unclassified Novosphingobium]|uniref:hypothetical protein n=1 Tax=unclassified Novosphingobium TaxID=2644732 RepID=UPI00135BADD8|nr:MULTISPECIES: hypothetical protein [unclassified Novosphingobium]
MSPIEMPEVVEVHLFNDFVAQIALVPPGLPFDEAPWECDDRSITSEKSSGSLWFKVFRGDDLTPVGIAVFAANDSEVQCDNIEIDCLYRCKGLAKELYRLAACIFDAPVVPSKTLLDGGEKFWENRTAIHCE